MSESGDEMHITAEIDGEPHSGEATWSVESGFHSSLKGLIDPKAPSTTPGSLETLPVTVDTNGLALLINAKVSPKGYLLKVDTPFTISRTLSAEAMIADLPWPFPDTIAIEHVCVSSRAMMLWYGEGTQILVERRPDGNFETTATFKTEETQYDLGMGKLKISKGIKTSGFPAFGNYTFSTPASATIEFASPVSAHEALREVRMIECFFDIITAFPARSMDVTVKLRGIDRSLPMRCLLQSSARPENDHPFSVFLTRDDSDYADLYSSYRGQFHKREYFQQIVRYLSGDRLTAPEGFLTACNVIETIGESAPRQEALLKAERDLVDELVAASGSRKHADAFGRIRARLPDGRPSFNQKFVHATNLMQSWGLQVNLQAGLVSNVRSKHRHRIVELTKADVVVMRAAAGFAWILGLAWLCKSIGMPDEKLTELMKNGEFHLSRRTGLPQWGKIRPNGDEPT